MLQQKFTHDFMRQNCGCYYNYVAMIDNYKQLDACSFMLTGNEFITLEEIMRSEIPSADKLWFLQRLDISFTRKTLFINNLHNIVCEIERKFPLLEYGIGDLCLLVDQHGTPEQKNELLNIFLSYVKTE